jgi:hypothetical protein
MASNPEETEGGSGGSWLPLVVIIVLLCVRWAAYGQGNTPVRIRRWYNLQVRRRTDSMIAHSYVEL